MFKLWARTVKEDKITRDYLYKNGDKFDAENLLSYLAEICHELDIPTPVILKNHIENLYRFNIVKFKDTDFVESVDFESFIVENASE